ncbi:MAG: aminopeptidase C [Saprospiraceae bacterium]
MEIQKIPALLFVLLCFFSVSSIAQVDTKKKKTSNYQFTVQEKIDCTPVKSQGRTGTCWSYATSSFLESELIRKGKGKHDLSEMFAVSNIYKDKARNYVYRQGKANFSQGSLAHDPIAVAKRYGIVPEAVYSGKEKEAKRHDHSEMEKALKGMLDGVLKQKRLSKKWFTAFQAVLDVYLGSTPENFTYEGKQYTPKSFAESMEINPEDYVSITSFTHHPFYEKFILEIPDNYSNGSFYNLPIQEVEAIVDNAIKKGYSVAWDGDVSEKGFSAGKGIAVAPVDDKREDLFLEPGPEMKITQNMRQETFESFSTTDDHLMHLMGTAKDQKGTKYYIIKNSWGEISEHKGFLYMSAPYMRLKMVAILVHKDAIPKNIASKLTM